jgi:hypothetical protein
VAGTLKLEPSEAAVLPPALIGRGQIESDYERVLLALSARLDPVPHDPWPNHWTASGASLAFTLRAYRAIGGLPLTPSGEDRALIAALFERDLRVRHDPDIAVITSARLVGRAQGGTADAIRQRCIDPDMPGDDCLEPFPTALRRYLWRRRLRVLRMRGQLRVGALWANVLGLPPSFDPTFFRTFGALWRAVEAASPFLSRTALRPSEMQNHGLVARAALTMLGPPTLHKGKSVEAIRLSAI